MLVFFVVLSCHTYIISLHMTPVRNGYTYVASAVVPRELSCTTYFLSKNATFCMYQSAPQRLLDWRVKGSGQLRQSAGSSFRTRKQQDLHR
jgi:hypothetical protein